MSNVLAVEGIELNSKVSLNGSHVGGKLNEARTFGLNSQLNFNQYINEKLKINLAGGLSLETGNSETVYGAGTFKPTNSLYLINAKAIYSPFKRVTLAAGAINQNYQKNPLFITSTPFIGAQEVFSYKISNWTIELDLLQSIPSNHTLSKRLGSVNEGSAKFYNEKIRVKGEGNVLSVNASIGHFAFDQLSSSVAYESRLLGNSVSGIGNINNKFKYSFIGWNGDFALDYKNLPGTTISLNSAWHLNSKAPSNKNLGYKIGPSIAFESGNRIYKIELESFENQSDSAVAYYSSKNYGHVNRKGAAIGASVDDIQNQINYGLKGVDTKPIISSPFQSKERIISIFLRKNYELF